MTARAATRSTNSAKRRHTEFRCQSCGWTTAKWVGKCGSCGEWGTVVEIDQHAAQSATGTTSLPPERVAAPMPSISFETTQHLPTGIGEFDRVLGGGLVKGATILVSGEPGVGKSTLLLDAAQHVAEGHSANGYSTEGHSTEEHSTEEHSTEEHSTDVHSVKGRNASGRSTEGRNAEAHYAEARNAVSHGVDGRDAHESGALQHDQPGRRVLYCSAEESLGQVRMRAERMGAVSENLYLAAETDLSYVLAQIDAIDPSLVIVDSIQTVTSSDSDTIAGGSAQVRIVANTLTRAAKAYGFTMLIVGHVTKDGNVAGPRTLEHLVDVVCQFEGDRQGGLRFIRALKNRFGPTDELGCFELAGDGIHEVPDPSQLFVARAEEAVPGTCVTFALEGRRVLPVEIQALVVPTSTAQPRRVTSGVDSARVAMILAVLEKRIGLPLSTQDVYVSTVGGVKLQEPGADLAIACAVASAVRNKTVPHTVAAFGEISLAGQVRVAANAAQRTVEASRLGYTTVVSAEAKNLQAALRAALNSASA